MSRTAVKLQQNTPLNKAKSGQNCPQVQLPKYVIQIGEDWHVRRTFPTARRDEKGRIIYVSIKRKCPERTKDAAERLAREIETAVRTPVIKTEILGDFIRSYLTAKRGTVSRRTFEAIDDYFTRLLGGLSSMRMGEIKPLDIQRHYDSLNRSASTIRKFHKTLSAAFNQAVAWDVIAKNPCKNVLLPRISQKKIVSFDVKQAQAFLAECRKNDRYIILEFLLETGLRPSEALALTWDDIDLEKRTVNVNKSLARGFVGGGVEIKDTKTRTSNRIVQITSRMCERLVPKKGLVFPSATGGYQAVGNLNRREFKTVLTNIGLSPAKYSLYCLRHTCASLSLAAGADVKTISDKLGHKDAALTLNVYSHVLAAMRTDATEKLAGVLYGKKGDLI